MTTPLEPYITVKDDELEPLEASYETHPITGTNEDANTPFEPYITVEDDVLEATEIALLPSQAEQDRRKFKKLKIYGAIAVTGVVIVVVAITLPIFFIFRERNDSNQLSSLSPSVAPSSSSPTELLYLNYIDFFSNISDITDLTTTNTPQHSALQWIYYDDPEGRLSLSHPRLNQRYIAAVFYYSTSRKGGWSDCYPGDVLCNSDHKSAWLSSHDECDWYRFEECNSDGFVQRFDIRNNQNTEMQTQEGNSLIGSLPSEFGYLENLTDLTIAYNDGLESSIPSNFSKLHNLISWVFNENNLVGPLYEQMF